MKSIVNDPFLVTLRRERNGLVALIESCNGYAPAEYTNRLFDVDKRIAEHSTRIAAGASIVEVHTDFITEK